MTHPMRRFLVGLVVMASLLCPLAAGRSVAAASKGKAYIWIGDIKPTWYSLLLRSAFGKVDPYKELKPVIAAQKKKLAAQGYQVKVVDTVSAHEIKKALHDPETKAFAFFGHGDPNVAGTLSTLSGEDITAGNIKEWAQKKLAKRIGTPKTWRSLSKAERRKRRDAWNNAHFNLQYVYMHTCYGLKDNSMVDALMADNGEFRGYKGKAYLKDQSVAAKNELGRMQDRLAAIKAQHRALKVRLDASGGHDAATSKKMSSLFQQFKRLRKQIAQMKAISKYLAR